MTLQFDTATRNGRLDAIETVNGSSCALEIRTGAQPANCAAASTGSILVTINLPADWMNAAASGSKSKSGSWSDTSADGTGDAGHFRVYNDQTTKDGTTCFLQGSVTATGGGGDLTLDNVSIASGQTVTVSTFTISDGNA